jgi:uncharacterized protein (TIGR01777 family)
MALHVLVTGSSGLVGSALVPALERAGHQVTALVRRAPATGEAEWHPEAGTIDRAAVGAADAIVHLAGAGVGEKRWSPDHKRNVLESRVKGTTLLSETIARLPEGERPRVFVSGSAVGYYGDRGGEVLTERSAPGAGFLADVATHWEAATVAAEDAGVRVVHLRSGIVITANGGAMGRMIPLFRLGLGGRLGSGKQYWSWVSLADEVGLIMHALDVDAVRGPMNATGPEPVTVAELTRALARVLHRPAALAVPAVALRVVMGRQMAFEMVLGGQRAIPEVARSTGYSFQHADVWSAFGAVLGRRR